MMITSDILRQRIREQPFRPFRIALTDGRAFDVPNHDFALVKRNTIEIGVDAPDLNSYAQKYLECAILHISSIEDVTAAARLNSFQFARGTKGTTRSIAQIPSPRLFFSR